MVKGGSHDTIASRKNTCSDLSRKEFLTSLTPLGALGGAAAVTPSELQSAGGLLHAIAEVIEHGSDGLPGLTENLVRE